MIFRNFLFFIFGLISCNSQGIIITQYPPSKVNIDSSQVISWKSPIKLDSVSIDLYQRKQFKQNLGNTNQNLNNFKWDVSRNCDLGDEYYIKITGKSHINGTAWVNTPKFSIVLDGITAGTISIITIVGIIVLLILCVYACNKKKNRRKSILGDLNSPLAHPGIPVAQPAATTYPPTLVHHQPSATTYPPTVIIQPQRPSYSRGSVTGAAAGGLVTGIVVDELIHRGGHRHHHQTNHRSDFGGGSFFGEDNSGGDASDSSWGFFSDTDNSSGGGAGDNSGGFY